MELLINRGDFEILASSPNPLNMIKKAACTCYQSEQRTMKDDKEFVKMLANRGHWSMFDHVSATVWFKNTSRGLSHELVRHRLAAFAQESTRYVDPTEDPLTGEPAVTNLKVVAPPHRDVEIQHDVQGVGKKSFREMAQIVENFYKALRQAGWAQEDARQILPIGTKSEIVMTADFTEWRHVFRLRTQKAAHWEIRTVMCKLLEEFKTLFAPVFDDFVLVGKDKNHVPYYKIAGYVKDATALIDNAVKAYPENKEFGEYLKEQLK